MFAVTPRGCPCAADRPPGPAGGLRVGRGGAPGDQPARRRYPDATSAGRRRYRGHALMDLRLWTAESRDSNGAAQRKL